MKGTVIKSTGSFATVRGENEKEYACKVKGTFRLQEWDTTNPVAVGDRVELEIASEENVSYITKIFDRKNYIIRKSLKLSKQVQVIAANIDMALVIATPISPKTSTGFIDRFLATAEAYSIPAGIIFNKSDLYDDDIKEYTRNLSDMYRDIGYLPFIISAQSKDEIRYLREALSNKVTLFSGHSGVGKSTLINALIPGLNIKTGNISKQFSKGTHTTTFAEMHAMPNGGFIIDTPGIREFGVIDFNPAEVSHYFPELFAESKHCKFYNCMHVNEKDCAVLRALEENRISMSRYNSYLSILNNEDIFK